MVKNHAAIRMFSACISHIGCKCLDFRSLLLSFSAASVIVGDVAGTDTPHSEWRRGYREMHVRADKV